MTNIQLLLGIFSFFWGSFLLPRYMIGYTKYCYVMDVFCNKLFFVVMCLRMLHKYELSTDIVTTG